jgi:hypothetical protein
MNKRVALVSVVLAAALVAAVFGATEALRLIGGGSTFSRPLSDADVRSSLAASPSTPAASPSGTTSPRPLKSGSLGPVKRRGARMFGGNTVFASCTGSQATITTWIPASGFSIDESSRGPGSSAWVKFKSESSEITVTVTCAGGRPQFGSSSDDRGGGHGGGSGRGRGGGG